MPATLFLLGIDPGTSTGLARVCASTGAVLFVESASPLETVRQLEAWAAEGSVAGAYVEDSRELPIYARHGSKGRGERDRVARSVGGVDTLTTLYADLLTAHGIPVELVEPVRAAKWDAETCAQITGWTARSNQHGRDALRLVFGRCLPRFSPKPLTAMISPRRLERASARARLLPKPDLTQLRLAICEAYPPPDATDDPLIWIDHEFRTLRVLVHRGMAHTGRADYEFDVDFENHLTRLQSRILDLCILRQRVEARRSVETAGIDVLLAGLTPADELRAGGDTPPSTEGRAGSRPVV